MAGGKSMDCPICKSNYTIKKGRVRRKRRSFQKYKCNKCGAFFTEKRMQNKSFDPETIMFAITQYNKGLTLLEASKETNKKFHVRTYPQLISSWLKEFKEITTYQKIRKELGKRDTSPIYGKTFHHKQFYEFQYHKIKAEKFINNYFSALRNYLQTLPQQCPNQMFEQENTRSSQLKINVVPTTRTVPSHACKISGLALMATKDNKKRHSTVQEFMLCNDTSTLATEVPIWLHPKEFSHLKLFKEIATPITGHIDLIQARYGLLHILDYKPEAEKEKPIAQLFSYALALSTRTNIWLRNFKCAWFNEKTYKEFSPAEIILKNENIPQQETRKYLLNEEKQLFHEKRMFKEMRQTRISKKKTANETYLNNIRD